MKSILPILLVFIWCVTTSATDTTIVFKKISHSDVFELAKKENKKVMLYFHFDGCGACVTMEKTAFKDKSVFEFFNSNFVNFEINTLKGEGLETNKIYNIKLHPTFLFFDSEGNELHRMVGIFSPEEFYMTAYKTLNSNRTLTKYKEQYNAGNRTADFLFDYAYILRDAYELDSTVVSEYLGAIEPKAYSLERNLRFIYEFCVHNHEIFIPFDHSAFSFLSNNADLFKEHFDIDQVDTRIVWILSNTMYKAIKEKDEKRFYQTIEIIKAYDKGEDYLFKENDGRVTAMISGKNLVLSSKLLFFEKMGDQSNYIKTLDQYTREIWNDASELNSFAWRIFVTAADDDFAKIKTAIQYSIRSIELKNSYSYNDTYACLLYKSGEKEKALLQAQKAIDIAKETGQNYDETQKLIDRINEEK
ncbi:MAG: thioredoxin fold domain-containing protein [Saprospiraceae bacterium]|nr:thioredoxin fold domain-containing protein [Saprospiraceae bacterium]